MRTFRPALPLARARVRALLFDVDGTLSDSDDHVVARLATGLGFLDRLIKPGAAHQFSRAFVHFAETPGNWLLEMADRLNLDPHLAAFLDRRASEKEAIPENFPAIAGILSMLESLKASYPLAVVSARNEVTTRHFLRLNQLEEYFQVVVTSQTCQRTKPFAAVSYTHLRAHETVLDLVCRLLLEKKKNTTQNTRKINHTNNKETV